ncbi:hypothetical protein PspLS_07401 [Pyricularia sp. CBS 133598]|nr:hypothetical protein PspLS_07401 [Pyricularia sp. CBS 133598]
MTVSERSATDEAKRSLLGTPYLKILLIRVKQATGQGTVVSPSRRPPSTARLEARCQISNSCYLSKDASSPSTFAACVSS